ncbi:N-lysine methyltransferase setd6 [Clupea harengus]|uniref:N-lysine methyltransferase SETD6 n=1 Tax=Clupea harengus TaxID=7950 RepID=A0A8M1K9A9_CLUHA|nr:N-lysine methyltransferase setd6 [Clupea harengus]
MASNVKRPKIAADSEEIVDEPLQNFLQWCHKVELTMSNKVYLSKEGTVAEYGMLAKQEIDEGEVLFSIPRNVLLNQQNSKIKAVLEESKVTLENTSGWVPLLMALMYEYTYPQSHWTPYLSLWPNFKAPDHPMFWSKEERDKLLKGTGIREAVETDLTNIQNEYTDIVLPFIRSHLDLWDPEKHTLDLYKSLVAFVMAYSFQEPLEEEEEDEKDPNPPMMVPMADMLNHVSNHNANLEYTPEYLKMVAIRSIKAGEEIFNTYGEMANWQLLHMYGFTEPHQENSNDTADIQMTTVQKVALQLAQNEEEQRFAAEKWNMLCDMEMVGDQGAFIFGKKGCLTDTEMYTTLKILSMEKEEFEVFQDREWEEVDDEDEMAQALSYEGLPVLPPAWRRLLHAAIGATLDSYEDGVEADRKLLEEQEVLAKLDSRSRRALQVRYGQKKILQQLQQLTQSGASTSKTS